MFIGRKEELDILKNSFLSREKTAILVYGKRRVGKSTLIDMASKCFSGTVINHICIKSSYEGNLNMLARSISMSMDLPGMSFGSIFDIFDFLKKQSGSFLVILDEYQYFKESLHKGELDSFMQIIIDTLPDNIKIVLCGSYISVMKELQSEDNPLFGRFTDIISLKEMDYYEASLFMEDESDYKKIEFYSVFGGSPFVLSKLDYSKSLEWNIKTKLIAKDSILWTHIESVMLKEIQKAYDIMILHVMGNGKKKYSELVSYTGTLDNGNMDKQLKNLIQMETIEKTFPINRKSNKKLTFYEIKDNLMRFFFRFLFGNETLINKIGEEAFFNNEIKSSIQTFIDHRLEDIARQYFEIKARTDGLAGIYDVGTYWYDNSREKKNGEFDCVVKGRDGYTVYEVKNYKRKIKIREMLQEISQINDLGISENINIGFICPGGFEKKIDGVDQITDLFCL